jgi:hypothetical protein
MWMNAEPNRQDIYRQAGNSRLEVQSRMSTDDWSDLHFCTVDNEMPSFIDTPLGYSPGERKRKRESEDDDDDDDMTVVSAMGEPYAMEVIQGGDIVQQLLKRWTNISIPVMST